MWYASVFFFLRWLSLLFNRDYIFRRTPRRKLVFSSSDDETEHSPQSISSGKTSKEYRNSIIEISSFLFLVHILRQEHQDEQWVFAFFSPSHPRLFVRSFVRSSSFMFWSRSNEVDCLHPMVHFRSMPIGNCSIWFMTSNDWITLESSKVSSRPLMFVFRSDSILFSHSRQVSTFSNSSSVQSFFSFSFENS